MYQEKMLSNGIRVYMEQMPGLHSAAVGIFVKAGSSTELTVENGLSHFLEHMFFKGTEKRDYKQIAAAFDNMGVQTNAYTSKELTCYYIRSLDEKLPEAMDILLDMFTASTFPEAEVQKEQGVIVEEIAMTMDAPDSLLMERLTEEFFKGTSLSQTILGPAENILAFNRDDLLGYKRKHYTAQNVIVSIVGSFDEAQVLDMLEAQLGSIEQTGEPTKYEKNKIWKPQKQVLHIEKDIEQAHVGVAFEGPSLLDDDRYVASVVVNILGGGMSSRLFQEIREEMGAAYAVYAYPSIYSQTGMIVVYAGTSVDKAELVKEAILKQTRRMRSEGISVDDLENTKVQLAANYVLGQENSSSRMNLLGRNALLLGRVMPEEEVLAKINGITMDQIQAYLQTAFDEDYMVVAEVSPK